MRSLGQGNFICYIRYFDIPGVPKEAERSIFVTLMFQNILMSSDKTLSSEKNDTKIIWFGSVVLILQPFLDTQSVRAIYGGYGSP